jgi:hypothetical protein
MKAVSKVIVSVLLGFSFSSVLGQSISNSSSDNKIVLDSNKVKIFERYVQYNHSNDPGGFLQWKTNNPDLYIKEMWYYTESFYIKRNYLSQGITMDEGMIYVPRFEMQRMPTTEVIIEFPGYKDVMVLIPIDKLLYKVN